MNSSNINEPAPQAPVLPNRSNDPFWREDRSKAENRCNQALFAAAGLTVFRTLLLAELQLPVEVAIVPSQWRKGRPDFTVKLRGQDVALIECKALAADPNQDTKYAAHSGLPVLWIVGVGQPPTGTTWQRVHELTLAARNQVGCLQSEAILDMLRACIDDVLRYRRPRRPLRWLALPSELPESPWFRQVSEPFIEPSRSKLFGACGTAIGSASLRLRGRSAISRRTAPTGVGLATLQAANPDVVQLPSARHLRQHLAAPLSPWVDDWERLMAETVGFVRPNSQGWLVINLASNRLPAAAVAEAFAKLAIRVLNL